MDVDVPSSGCQLEEVMPMELGTPCHRSAIGEADAAYSRSAMEGHSQDLVEPVRWVPEVRSPQRSGHEQLLL